MPSAGFDVHDRGDLVASRNAHKREATRLQKLRQAELALVARRNRQIKQLEQHDPNLANALKWALAQVGTTEQPPGSNQGPKIDQWNIASGISPSVYAYWCQSFANAVLVHGGGPQLKSAYTPTVVQWARDGKFGLKLLGSHYSDAKAGDFLYFKFPGVSDAFCDHVAVRLANKAPRTVEGNTSPGVSGSQNNGGCVGIHTTDRVPYVVAVVRPPYKR